jgi:3-oxoacyl-[acyl-carrier-protein] synthase III
MTQFLEQNQLTVEEIDLFLFSQFSIKISIPLLNISIYPRKKFLSSTGSRIYRFFKSFSGFA